VADLFLPLVSIAPTKRRRFLWVAYWSGPPCRDPFRAPDAHAGGARTEVEAHAAAELAAGMRLTALGPQWARAWLRVLAGAPAFRREAGPATAESTPPQPDAPPAPLTPLPPRAQSLWDLLQVAPNSTAEQVRAAYRVRMLQVHPDHGGSTEAFLALRAAFAEAQRRLRRPQRRGADRPRGGRGPKPDATE
jgi:DnaJ domain